MTTSKEESEKRVGAIIDERWQLDALIAHSSTAATYRARHRNGLEAAIKIIHRSHGEFEGAVERFLQEAHLANRIDHDGVERVLDDGKTDDGSVFLVMELLEGESLEDYRASRTRLSMDEIRHVFDGILDALIATHLADVLHRNIKPANVMVTNGGKRVVLTDFGRAKLMDGSPQSPLSIDGLVMGTPSYMSPEQARGKRKDVDARSDVFSVGAILFTMLTGKRIHHEAKSSQERLTLAATKPAPKIATILPDVDPKVADVIDRALAFEKEARWPSASAMRRAWWLATGRDEASLPIERKPGEREPAVLPQRPAGGWDVMGWSALILPARNERGPDLLPPPVSPFTEEATSPAVVRATPRSRMSWVIAVFVFLVIVAALLLALVFSD